MRQSSLLTVSALALFAGARFASAQPPESFPRAAWGPRVRVTVTGAEHGQIVGRYLRATGDTIWLDSGTSQGATAIPLARIARFEVSQGRHSNAGRGAAIGSAVGLGLGLAMVIGASTEDDSWCEPSAGEYAFGVLVLTGMGAGLGTGIGALTRSERWEAVPVAGLAVTRGSTADVRVGLTVRF